MRILVSGYYGFDNAGDELILNSLLMDLRHRFPEAGITVLSNRPEKTSALHGINSSSRRNLFRIVSLIRSSNIVITGGGGLFQDRTGSLSLYYYLLIIFLAWVFGKKNYIFGAGVNELKKLNRFMAGAVLSLATKITLRENISKDLLFRWGCPKNKIEVTADPVLLSGKKSNISAERTKVIFILRPPLKGQEPVTAFAKLADSIYQRISTDIVFMPFHPEYDLKFNESVMKAMKSPSKLFAWSNFGDLHDAVAASGLIISQRLHGLILALIYGVPMIGISDDPKIDRFLKELGQRNVMELSNENLYSLLAMITDVLEWKDEFRKKADIMLPTYRMRAKRNAEFLFG